VSILRTINGDAKYGKVTVGTTVVELKVGTEIIPGRTGLMVANASADTAVLYIGTDNSVTSSNGFPIKAGQHVFLNLVPGQKIYAICSTASIDARIIEIH
jgi:hypothetical protein